MAKAPEFTTAEIGVIATALEFYRKSIVRAEKAATVPAVAKAYAESAKSVEQLTMKVRQGELGL